MFRKNNPSLNRDKGLELDPSMFRKNNPSLNRDKGLELDPSGTGFSLKKGNSESQASLLASATS